MVELAVVVVGPDDQIDFDWTFALARSLSASDHAFTPSFVQDRLFQRAFNGDLSELQQLGIAKQIRRLILARRSTRTTESEVKGERVFRVDETMVLRLIDKEKPVSETVQFVKHGVGLSLAAAQDQAEKALLRKVTASLVVAK